MANTTNTGDIRITVGGSSTATILQRAAALDRLAMSLVTMSGALSSAGAAAAGGGGWGRMNTGLNQYNRNVGTARQRTDAFGTALGNGRNALDRFTLLFTRMLRIMTAYFIISRVTEAIRDLVTVLFSAPAQMELWNTQLRVLVGNATGAGQKLRLLQEVAIESPQNLKDLVSGLVTLTAFHVETNKRTLSLLADLAAVTGQTFQHVSEVAGKVIQGSPQAITRSLPVLGIDPKEFKALAAETGSRAEALFRIIEEKFKGFASESTNTIMGLVEKIRDTFFVLAAEIGEGLIPVMREALTGIFNWLNALRNNQAALDQIRTKIRVVADSIVTWTNRLIALIKFLKQVYDFIGGLKTLIFVLAMTNIPRLAVALAGLGAMNPWLVGLGLAAVAIGTAIDKLTDPFVEHSKAVKEAATAHKIFGEQLAETHKLSQKNISLVDAEEVDELVMKLLHLAQTNDPKAFADVLRPMYGDQVNGEKIAEMSVKRLKEWTMQLASYFEWIANNARGAMGVQSFSQGELDDVNEYADWLSKINKEWSEASELIEAVKTMQDAWLKQASDDWKEQTSLMDTYFQMHEDWLSKVNDDWEAHSQIIDSVNQMRENFIEQKSVEPFNRLKALTSAGMITKDEALKQATALRDTLANEVKRLLQSGDPLDLEMAFKVQGVIENIDNFKDELRTNVSEALKASLLDIVKDGANAISSALADMIVDVDNEGFGKALMGMIASFMNTFGDALIQLGIAKLAFDTLVGNIVNLIPGGGLAAIAAGIALKAFAGIITNSIAKSSENAGGSGNRSSGGGSNFSTFTPARYQSGGAVDVTIMAMDSEDVKKFVARNAPAFSAAVTHVASRDKATNGAAYGVFGGRDG